MSDDAKRWVAILGAAALTALLFGFSPSWPGTVFFLLLFLALHPILGLPLIWIEGGDAWDKISTVVMWALVLVGAGSFMLIFPDASWGMRIVALLVCIAIAAIFMMICETIRDRWQDRNDLGFDGKARRFRNPSNGYEENVGRAWLWCLLFGPVYFAAKGIWGHAAISLLLAILTSYVFGFFISWFIYPFFANAIVRKHYLRNGWVPA